MGLKLETCLIAIIIAFSLLSSPIFALNNNDYEYIYGVNNLLLIGANDNCEPFYNFFIVLTIDSLNKNLTLTSLHKNSFSSECNKTLYDLYLDSGEDCLIDSIKHDFNINIDNYVVINKVALAKIVDSVQYVKLNNKSASGKDILDFLNSTKYLNMYEQEKIQMDVIQELLYGFSRLPFSNYPYVIRETFDYVELNITPFRMLSLGFSALSLKNYKALQVQLP
ncbi:MAG: LCP family protein [Romboutsia sp.]|uniref:LCP family glycopolymer transferase n=1 Tax=Romboutsia sp. TaxID=1965302 RepID=UPI003F3235DE